VAGGGNGGRGRVNGVSRVGIGADGKGDDRTRCGQLRCYPERISGEMPSRYTVRPPDAGRMMLWMT
jgi:hypothetical protein